MQGACSLLNSNRIKQSHNHVTIQGSVNNGSVHELFDFVGEMVASVCGLLLRSGIRRLRNVGSVFSDFLFHDEKEHNDECDE